jgi:GntR family transcriptional regulator, histidine utilization repressor
MPLRHVLALHLADDRPFCLEDRWLNSQLIQLDQVAFDKTSANEWLVRNITFAVGTISFHALAAGPEQARRLDCAEGTALFAIDRTTRNPTAPITFVRLTYASGYRMHATL